MKIWEKFLFDHVVEMISLCEENDYYSSDALKQLCYGFVYGLLCGDIISSSEYELLCDYICSCFWELWGD